MPEKKTIERARKDKREGKSPTTQAGEFVREEIRRSVISIATEFGLNAVINLVGSAVPQDGARTVIE